jgi:hydroxyethylthiazole kinase-like uncharacterized protein yjeF
MNIDTSKQESIKPFIDKLYIPDSDTHKGQNGKLLIVGGSELFHAAPIWAADIATYFVDMIHFASTEENNEVLTSYKKAFRNGIVVKREDIEHYAKEDDVILIGPGLMRVGAEGEYTRTVTEKLLKNFPKKRFVLDAGALQMMDPSWMKNLEEKAIVTPHQKEFETLFGEDITQLSIEKKQSMVEQKAKEFHCVILLKATTDIVSDGETTYVITGGNQGLTKGGTGDTLAGLTASLYTKNDPVTSAVLASYFLKKAADSLREAKGYWYNTQDLIVKIPQIVKEIAL